MKEILVNKIKCKHCNDEIISRHRHDFRICKCGKVGVDGGNDYLKRMGTSKDYEELSVVEEPTHENLINNLTWGNNLDKDMNRLPEVKYILIKDLSTDHIQTLVDDKWVREGSKYHSIFIEELKRRNNGN